jgi:dipicolinate synthase subunit B
MKKTAGFALTGSFCTFARVIPQMAALVDAGYSVIPIMSAYAYGTDTRFGKAEDFKEQIRRITGRDILHTIEETEQIGPHNLLDILVVAPATGNTLAKMANGVNDTAVTMAAKATVRNGRPVLLAVSTNDALSGCGRNIGQLLNTRHLYFVPMRQDDPGKKPTSVVADFAQIVPAAEAALEGRQLEPLLSE